MSIIDINDYRPHVSIERLDGVTDSAPALMYQNIVDGKLKIADVEEYEVLMRSIIKDWLYFIGAA